MLETMAAAGPFSVALWDRAGASRNALAMFIEPDGRGHGVVSGNRSRTLLQVIPYRRTVGNSKDLKMSAVRTLEYSEQLVCRSEAEVVESRVLTFAH
jgi:hypothetical protein